MFGLWYLIPCDEMAFRISFGRRGQGDRVGVTSADVDVHGLTADGGGSSNVICSIMKHCYHPTSELLEFVSEPSKPRSILTSCLRDSDLAL